MRLEEYFLRTASVTPLRKASTVILAGALRMKRDMTFMHRRPLEYQRETLPVALLVLPSITAMKLSVTTIPSSGFFLGFFPIICFSITFIPKF